MLENKANVNAVVEKMGGRTPLHMAAGNDGPAGLDIANLILAANADIHAKNESGETVLFAAARNEMGPAMVRLLLGAGARVDDEDNGGGTVRDEAANVLDAGCFDDGDYEILLKVLDDAHHAAHGAD